MIGLLIVVCILIGVMAFSLFDSLTEISNNEKTFEELFDDLVKCKGTLNMTSDYKLQKNESIQILHEGNLTINGNGHKLDCSNRIHGIDLENYGENETVVINNLTIMNSVGSALTCSYNNLVLNNVVFENCTEEEQGIVSVFDCGNVTFNNCTFKLNSNASDIFSDYSNITINHSSFIGGDDSCPYIAQNRGSLEINDCNFENGHSKYGGIVNFKGDTLSIKNSNFSNFKASITGGGIVAKYFPKMANNTSKQSDPMVIENCTFLNMFSEKNGGAIYMDMDSGSDHIPQTLKIVNCNFTNCYSKVGGAIVNLGGTLNIIGSKFNNNAAKFKGGAIYTSWTDLTVENSTLSNNIAGSNSSAIYFDNGTFTINNSNLTENRVIPSIFRYNSLSNAIYANDADIHFTNSKFDNGDAIYGNFIRNYETENITSNDSLSLNNTEYIVFVENKGIHLDLKNNTNNYVNLPSKYDSRYFNWTSPLKYQGDNLACWSFATAGTVECSLLKSTSVLYNLSENNIQNTQLRYNPIGDVRNNVTGFAYSGLGYAVSWNGMVSAQDDSYDERGMISERVDSDRVHVQDAKFIFGGKNDTVKSIKQAIMEYGAVSIQYRVTDFNYNYCSQTMQPTHFVTLIGWDDSIPAKYFKDIDNNNKTPSKPGGWIVKDSEGFGVGDDGYDYISYYDKSFLANDYYAVVPQAAAVAYIFENTNDYHVNYQTDLTGLTGFDGNYTYYSNEFTSKYNESIGAVGTYFNDSDIDYSFDVYVNGMLVHSQNGTSEFAGYKTIVLDENLTVKSGDIFKVVFKSNAVPYQAFSRQHYMPGMSFVSDEGQSWNDITLDNKTVCLKVYTLE